MGLNHQSTAFKSAEFSLSRLWDVKHEKSSHPSQTEAHKRLCHKPKPRSVSVFQTWPYQILSGLQRWQWTPKFLARLQRHTQWARQRRWTVSDRSRTSLPFPTTLIFQRCRGPSTQLCTETTSSTEAYGKSQLNPPFQTSNRELKAAFLIWSQKLQALLFIQLFFDRVNHWLPTFGSPKRGDLSLLVTTCLAHTVLEVPYLRK